MRIAVLHWRTSSVGGINTCLQVYHKVAQARGDTFHVLESTHHKTKTPGLFGERRTVRGGDSCIVIDGEAPHHPDNWMLTASWLRDNYDVIMLSFLCPHPIKSYGKEPLFLPLLQRLKDFGMPIIGYVRDAYWASYAGFGELTLPLVDKTLVSQLAYGEPLVEKGYPVTPVYIPFEPQEEPQPIKKEKGYAVWTPQWKRIKGVKKFLENLPRLHDYGFRVDMFNNGIEYYYLRKTDDWKAAVGKDHFSLEHSGEGLAEFYGWQPLVTIARFLAQAEYMFDFQGHAAKYDAYKNGSYNNTIIEGLYYGAVPVVHSNILKSDIPAEFLIPVDNIEDYPEAMRDARDLTFDRQAMRDWVIENRSGVKLYDNIFEDYRSC